MRVTMPLILIVPMAAVSQGCGQNPDQNVAGVTGLRSTSSHEWCISWGRYQASGKLAYVVIVGHRKPVKSFDCLVSMGSKETVLRVPGDSDIRLPAKEQLFEYIDGKFQSSDKRVTAREFDAFLSSQPEDYSIDALLKFVNEKNAETR